MSRKYLQLVRVAPNGARKIMNTFGQSGRTTEVFFSMPWTRDPKVNMTLPETQMRAATEMRDGWMRNGPWTDHAFVIEERAR